MTSGTPADPREPTGAVDRPADNESSPPAEPALPSPVSALLLSWAADALRSMPQQQVPAPLSAVAKFRREALLRRGHARLLATLAGDESFRRAVLATRDDLAWLIPDIRGGTVPDAADPVELAALIYLERPRGWRSMLASVVVAEPPPQPPVDTGRIDALTRRVDRLTRDLAQERARRRIELDEARKESATQRATLRAALDEQRRQAAHLRAEISALNERIAVLTGELAAARTGEKKSEKELRRLRDARGLDRQERRAAETEHLSRLAVLLQALHGAARGLSQELALPAGIEPPASTLLGSQEAQGVGSVHTAADLEALLSGPAAHLIVDGYNVTLTALGTSVPLADQRSRLLRSLGPVSARTGTAVTVIFDGSDVTVAAPNPPRGVRVAFSDPAETADDLIVRILRAEPMGRLLMVATDDGLLRRRCAGLGAGIVPVVVLVQMLGSL